MDPVRRNVETIARLEEDFLNRRSATARLVDRTVDAVGSMPSFLIHLSLFAAWMLLNLGWMPFIKPWDPYPFILLTMTVSMEGVILALFVLMKQSRMSRRADERDHLHLQVNLLAEREITAMLRMQQQLADHLGLPGPDPDPEISHFARETEVEDVVRELKETLPEE